MLADLDSEDDLPISSSKKGSAFLTKGGYSEIFYYSARDITTP